MTTLTQDAKADRIEKQIEVLQARRGELRRQLWAIAGDQANADRQKAIMAIDKQIERLYFRQAEIELASEG